MMIEEKIICKNCIDNCGDKGLMSWEYVQVTLHISWFCVFYLAFIEINFLILPGSEPKVTRRIEWDQEEKRRINCFRVIQEETWVTITCTLQIYAD